MTATTVAGAFNLLILTKVLPEHSLFARCILLMMSAVLRGYQLILSPLIGPRCRHLPTCSEYADEALRRHGLTKGSWLAVKRICRCHPWGSSGYDPVPQPGDSQR